MLKRINEQTEQLQNTINELKTIIPNSYNDYIENIEKKAACERYFEKITESLITISYTLCKIKNFEIEKEEKLFDKLLENNIINKNICLKLKDIKGMRNIIIHQYGEIDNLIVFENLTKELLTDTQEFLNIIQNHIKLIS